MRWPPRVGVTPILERGTAIKKCDLGDRIHLKLWRNMT